MTTIGTFAVVSLLVAEGVQNSINSQAYEAALTTAPTSTMSTVNTTVAANVQDQNIATVMSTLGSTAVENITIASTSSIITPSPQDIQKLKAAVALTFLVGIVMVG